MTTTAPAAVPPAGLLSFLAARNLTPKQHEVACWFHAYHAAHGVSPTMQELGDEFGVSKVTALEHLTALRLKGVLGKRCNHVARGLYLRWTPPPRDYAGENKRLRTALRHYAEQAVGGEVAREALAAAVDGRDER